MSDKVNPSKKKGEISFLNWEDMNHVLGSSYLLLVGVGWLVFKGYKMLELPVRIVLRVFFFFCY